MKTRVRFAAIVAVLGLVIGFATERFLAAGLSFDALLTLRHAVLGDRHEISDSEVVVVNVDDGTFSSPGFENTPFSLWGPQFAAVLDALDRAGAKVIGADLIFSSTAETVPELRGRDRPLREALSRLAANHRIVLAETDVSGAVFRPHKSFAMMVRFDEGIRKANVVATYDGVARQVPLWQPSATGSTIPTLAHEVAKRAGFDSTQLPAGMRALAVNFADARVAPTYRIQDVHQCWAAGALEPLKAAFAGKIVVLGAELDVEDRKVTSGRAFLRGGEARSLPCASAASGEQASPQSRRTIPGVFIHAQAINDMLRGEIAQFWPIGLGMLAFAAMATAGSALSIFLRAQTASLLLVGALLLWLAGTTASASLDWFAPLLGGVAAAVSAFLVGLGLRTFVIDRERRRMALALSRYLDVHLAQKLMESDQPPELGGETREVTIWFSDIVGFSTVAEKMDAKELVSRLNAHFATIGQAIEAEGGIIDKYVGDAVVAIFGALVPLPNHAAAAMRAAIKVQERLAAEAGKDGAFRIRIGLNTGSCVVGNVGYIDLKSHINYTAIGDSVNVAARLEAANKELGTSILASESTVRAAGAGFVCRHLGPIHVKGRAEEVVVHEVVGLPL
jgi:adenylate cyclase